jgi:3-oxoadipate enol-lactonase
MSHIQTSYGNIYTEHHDLGHSETLLVLNGIMMSTVSWALFLPVLSQRVNVVLIDMLDQGKSDKAQQAYTVHDQSVIVHEVLQALSLYKVHVCGISYGGEVAMDVAINYPDQVKSLVLFNTTAKTSLWLRDIGESWIAAAQDPLAFYYTTIPTIYSHQFFEDRHAWMTQRKQVLLEVFSNREFIDSMIRLTHSSEDFDVLKQLDKITAPTLVVSSDLDTITPMYEQEKIVNLIPNAHHMVVKGSGHASMYEQPNTFISLVLGHVLHSHELKL